MEKKRQVFSRGDFSTDLNKRILEPEEVITGAEGEMYANRKDDRTLTSKMLAYDIFERIGKNNNARLLEVCCGAGQLANELSRYVKPQNITATDGGKELIDAAKKRYADKGIVFEVENVHEMNRNESFDCVICKDSFHHFTDSVVAIKELMKPLKKGGLLYIFDLTRAASDDEIEKRQAIIQKDHEAMRFLRSVNASLTPNEFVTAAKAAEEVAVEILYPFVYSEENKKLHQAEIEKDITGEANMSSLFSVYLVRKR
jgi:ubiquinone/menaquinone biosynthesis C-methylase UbiE